MVAVLAATKWWEDGLLGDEVDVLVVADISGSVSEHPGVLAGRETPNVSRGRRPRPGTQPPGSRWAAALTKQATCSSWVVRFPMVLKTR